MGSGVRDSGPSVIFSGSLMSGRPDLTESSNVSWGLVKLDVTVPNDSLSSRLVTLSVKGRPIQTRCTRETYTHDGLGLYRNERRHCPVVTQDTFQGVNNARDRRRMCLTERGDSSVMTFYLCPPQPLSATRKDGRNYGEDHYTSLLVHVTNE